MLCLKDIMYEARLELGEPNAFNWADIQLIHYANSVVKEISSTGGALTKYQSVTLQNVTNETEGLQETALDVEIDKVKSCKYFNGYLYDLEFHEWKTLQTGAITGSIPIYYYLKTSTKDLTPQVAATSNIQQIAIPPNTPFGTVYRTVIGCWPIPPQPAQLQVWYSYFHDYMLDPTDPCEIPQRFLRAITYGIMERALRTEKAHDEANEYKQMYEKYLDEYRIYCSRQRNADKPARYGTVTEPWRRNASSSIIVISPTGGS